MTGYYSTAMDAGGSFRHNGCAFSGGPYRPLRGVVKPLEAILNENTQILDVCCGSRMFHFDRQNPDVTYVDKRRETHILPDISSAA